MSSHALITTRRIGSLSVAEAGTPDGRPILFLHGIGSSGDAFRSQLAHFGANRWCLAPDAPGYARSDDDRDISSLAHYVDRFVSLLDRVDAPEADVLGVSWGGVIATRLAADHPDRVRRLVLVDTSRGSGRTEASATAMRQRAATFDTEGGEAFARARTPRLLAPSASADLAQSVATTMIDAIRLPGYGQAADSMAETDNTEALRAITAPTLVIVGAEDAVCPPAEAEVLAGLVPGASLELIEDAGHLTNQEQPAVFNRLVEAFLKH